ncbi:hypothetical protein A2W24_00030 [Microgenomates group bacterium RBG_16_45_19]|nr:MAG: hypothetical protein A2W24_00030 [Microgenomates group bacterium RBG_16_45_19]
MGVLEGQKEELKLTNLEANFFGESVLLTMKLGVDGQMEVIGSDPETLERIKQKDPNKKDVYISVRVPPSKYSNRSLAIVVGKLDGTCPVMWDDDNANLFAPVWETKAKLEIELLKRHNNTARRQR